MSGELNGIVAYSLRRSFFPATCRLLQKRSTSQSRHSQTPPVSVCVRECAVCVTTDASWLAKMGHAVDDDDESLGAADAADSDSATGGSFAKSASLVGCRLCCNEKENHSEAADRR